MAESTGDTAPKKTAPKNKDASAASSASAGEAPETAGGRRGPDTARVRDLTARLVWTVFVALALVMATAAFSYALEANPDNDLVRLVRDLGSTFDLGFFDLDNPVKAFQGENAQVKTALFNYGLASAAYLVVGRVLERIIRP